jgi:putative transposase
MPNRYPTQLPSFDYVGLYRYSLTFCTDLRHDLFNSREVVDLVLAQILRAASEQWFAVIAYCFMPDHLHLLIEGCSERSDCRAFIARAKQYSAFYYAQKHGSRLWQRYGFEHVIRDSELTLVVARYILSNPVRAGLAERVEDYPFVGSLTYQLRELLEACAAPKAVSQ